MTFKRILIPLDGSQLAEESLPHAEHLAHAFNSEVMLLHVLGTQPSDTEACADSVDWRLRPLEPLGYLKRIANQFVQAGINARYNVTEGRPNRPLSLRTSKRST
jgi:nucleotide-binding universal stress UspA family protein